MSVLVTGGAGYIGSHMVLELVDRGERVVVLDDLSTGARGLIAKDAHLVEGDVADSALVGRLIREVNVDCVIHFAGSIVVPESVQRPLDYYRNNTLGSHALIAACIAGGVKQFVFSSTAVVYGLPATVPIVEDAPTNPISPYGRSKLMTEWMLEDAARAHDFHYAALRYFNVAGADPKGRSGQSGHVATHLIKRACQVALGRVPHLDIFGTDYPTPDGTGVRDYIHVTDLVAAHIAVLDALKAGMNSIVCNCGYGHGFSVREVIAAVERVTGRTLAVREGPRRAGDAPSLISDPSRLKAAVRWQPKLDDLDEIVRTAYAWEERHG